MILFLIQMCKFIFLLHYLCMCMVQNFNLFYIKRKKHFRNDGQEFGASVYQKVNENLETGVQLAWSAGNNATTFGLGCVYSIDSDTSLRVNIFFCCNFSLKF